ncbi:hypothetical protein E2320_019933, partial [Naja naja]
MGGKLSKVQEQHLQELEKLAESVQKSVGTRITKTEIRRLLTYLWQQFPSYPEAGSLQVATWKKMGKAMHQAPRAPAGQLVAWRKLMEVLVTHENPMELTSLAGEELPPYSPQVSFGIRNLMIPADWKALFKMLLTPSQYVVFDFHYKQQAIARGQHKLFQIKSMAQDSLQ